MVVIYSGVLENIRISSKDMGTLFVVGTPIGNLEDITLRALRVLREVDVIFAEDLRVTRKLLSYYGIGTPIARVHTRNEKRAATEIIRALQEGKNIALTSDAGTPGISDPGSKLISLLVDKFKVYDAKLKNVEREERAKLINIQTIPGPSALTAALSVAGVPASEFLFLGFLPHKKGRETLFKEIAASKRPVVFYESPHRILKTLQSLQKFLSPTSKSAPEVGLKRITVCRELTKIHEEVKSASAAELLEYFKGNPEKVRGEFVVIIS